MTVEHEVLRSMNRAIYLQNSGMFQLVGEIGYILSKCFVSIHMYRYFHGNFYIPLCYLLMTKMTVFRFI